MQPYKLHSDPLESKVSINLQSYFNCTFGDLTYFQTVRSHVIQLSVERKSTIITLQDQTKAQQAHCPYLHTAYNKYLGSNPRTRLIYHYSFPKYPLIPS